jgi:hypothetical protein
MDVFGSHEYPGYIMQDSGYKKLLFTIRSQPYDKSTSFFSSINILNCKLFYYGSKQ